MSIIHKEYELSRTDMAWNEDHDCMSPVDPIDNPAEPTIIWLCVSEETYTDEGETPDEIDFILDIEVPVEFSEIADEIELILSRRVDMANELGTPFS